MRVRPPREGEECSHLDYVSACEELGKAEVPAGGSILVRRPSHRVEGAAQRLVRRRRRILVAAEKAINTSSTVVPLSCA